MIAAIYARKSTEQHVADEQKSVARQVDHAKQYAARKGWTVNEACIFVDDGISGAEFANRPGFVRLMNALKPRPRFQVLIMSEESRLGRESIETAYALKQLIRAGVRVFFYLEDRERTLDSPIEKAMYALQAMNDEMERVKASQRTSDALERKARAGYVTGGSVFGFDNFDVLDVAGRRSHVERRINEAEAAVVRRIFELAVGGLGQKRIAMQLNAEGAIAPRAQQERPHGWAQSSVHAVLFRELYRGEIVWKRTRKRNRWGEKLESARPESEWLRVPAPHLRIVPEDLWQAAHARIADSRAYYEKATHGLRQGRPRAVDSKYLLPGFARCGCCKSGLHVRSTHHGSVGNRRRVFLYACTAAYNRGPDVCGNAWRARMDEADQLILARIGAILSPDLVDDVITRMRELLEPERQADAREQLARQVVRAARDVEKYAEAIALAGDVPAVVRRLRAAEERRQALALQLETLGQGSTRACIDWRAVERQARQRMGDWRALLGRQVADARALLRELLVDGPLRFTPFTADGRRWYRIEGTLRLTGAFEAVTQVIGMASPPGFEPGFQP